MPPPTYVNPDQLRAAYRGLDAELLRARLASGELTAQAREIAQAELDARGPEGAPRAPLADGSPGAQPGVQRGAPWQSQADAAPPRTSGPHVAMRVLLVLYLLLLLLCAGGVLLDPPRGNAPRGAYDGFIGIIASFAAGFPWTLAGAYAARAIPFSGKLILALGETGIVVACWLGAGFNLFLFRLYFRR